LVSPPPPPPGRGDRRSMEQSFSKFTSAVSRMASHPYCFVAGCALVVIWLGSGPYFQFNDTWQLLINTPTTVLTFLWVVLQANTQFRDMLALQLKVDKIEQALPGVDDSKWAGIEDLSQRELSERKRRARDRDGE
jgi:low affinity Fe/Cu permease